MTKNIDGGRRQKRLVNGALYSEPSESRQKAEPEFGAESIARAPLFIRREWIMHSGQVGHYEIRCSSLLPDEVACFAWLIAQRGPFSDVYGIPRGGVPLAKALEPYRTADGPKLIIDDVLTTGASMEEARRRPGWQNAIGVVLFTRGERPDWVRVLCDMSWISTPGGWDQP